MTKANVPNNVSAGIPNVQNLTSEQEEYNRLYKSLTRTQTGEGTYLNSPSSGLNYTTNSYPLDPDVFNKGEEGLMNMFAKYILVNFNLTGDEINAITNGIDQSLNFATLTSGTAIAMTITTPTTDGITFRVEVPVTITGGAITIARNGGTAYPLYSDYELTEAVTELEAGIYSFDTRTMAFQLASSDAGNVAWLNQYLEYDPNNILLHFDGLDTSTDIIDEYNRTWTANGNAQIDTAESKFGGASILFDGTGDWVDTDNVSDLDFTDSDFTIDFQFRKGVNGVLDRMCGQSSSGGETALSAFRITNQTNNTVRVQYSDGTSIYTLNSTVAITDSIFHHFELVQGSNTLYLFIDGNLEASISTAVNKINKSNAKLAIGRDGEFASQYFTGHVDEFNLIIGVAKHTSNFTPPTQAYANPTRVYGETILLDEKAKPVPIKTGEIIYNEFYETLAYNDTGVTDPNLKSLLHFDGLDGSTTFTDEKGLVWTANGNAQIDTASKKFGTASGLFDGTGDWIDTPDSSVLNLGGNDFTIDMQVMKNLDSVTQYFFGQSNAGATDSPIYCGLRSDNKLEVALSDGVTTKTIISVNTITVDGLFRHFAFERYGDTFSLYIDGVEDSTLDVAGYILQDSASKFAIGRLGELTSLPFNGHIDEFRIVNGEAKFKGNFIPPTKAYTTTIVETQFFPPTTQATSVSDLTATIDGILEMANPVQDQVYQGFKSKVDLWDVGMEGNGFANIKSIQSGTTVLSGASLTISELISPVDDTKCQIYLSTNTNATQLAQAEVDADISGGNSLDFERQDAGGSPSVSIFWIVVEYENVKSFQKGTYIYTGTFQTEALSAVDRSKTIFMASKSYTYTGAFPNRKVSHRLSSDTAIQYASNQNPGNTQIKWRALEFN